MDDLKKLADALTRFYANTPVWAPEDRMTLAEAARLIRSLADSPASAAEARAGQPEAPTAVALVAECAPYLKEGETPAQRIERERRDTEAVLTLLVREKKRAEAMEELLRSAHAIADRGGVDTAWETFAASIQMLGIGAVTARTYRTPRSGAGSEEKPCK